MLFRSKENLLGQEGMGFPIAMDLTASTFMMVGAMGVGVARAAIEYAFDHASKRISGSTEIINHQAISHKIADAIIQIESARLLTWKAAWTNNLPQQDPTLSMMAKVAGSEAANKITSDALQIFGGYGYSKEYPLEKLVRDAKIFSIYDAPNEVHRNGIVQMFRMMKQHV